MLRVLSVLLLCIGAALARGAGRAFPIDSENYAIDSFQKLNRFIEWDETNFLVDLSGQYANCDNIGRSGFINVDRLTQEGVDIAAYVDDTAGTASDVNAVNSYIRDVIDRWMRSYDDVYYQIQEADRFGCSVRPGCSGRVSVACLFSPGRRRNDQPNDATAKQNAVAFTRDQYDVAEAITGHEWDNDNFLENLSGFEMSCAMVTQTEMVFAHATAVASGRGMKTQMLYEVAENQGETEPAMKEALANMKKMYGVKKVGCSLIPDCMEGEKMYVVVGCLFQMA